jgi:hypothetical protein
VDEETYSIVSSACSKILLVMTHPRGHCTDSLVSMSVTGTTSVYGGGISV